MKKQLSLRFNLVKLEHQKAYQILKGLPNGRMNEYIINAIIKAHNQAELKELIADTMVEVMDNYEFSKSKIVDKKTETLDHDALDFISSL